MNDNSLHLEENYWEDFSIQSEDIEFLFNHLLELEEPRTPTDLLEALINQRIELEKKALNTKQNLLGAIYQPKETYEVGQTIIFPQCDWQKGIVTNTRYANNPEFSPFKIIEIKFESEVIKEFASNFPEHVLNSPISFGDEDPNLEPKNVIEKYGDQILSKITIALENNQDLVMIAGKWFPKSLLIDVNIGHLNLIEAILEEAGGGPVDTTKLIQQVEIPSNINPNLIEFSFNYCIQEDERFDEVGPAGETLWYLRRLEPNGVQNQPEFLKYSPVEVDHDKVNPLLNQLSSYVHDELSEQDTVDENIDKVTISLIYPHWRSGTLPLTNQIRKLFPTAYEAPRVRFQFIDADSNDSFSGWVVRPYQYVYGLKEWYENQGLIPGSLVTITKSNKPGEVILKIDKRRQNREWIRTILIGADGGVVFAMLKQTINATYDERMAIFVPDPEALDNLWHNFKPKASLEGTLNLMSRELAKLNPQGHIHVQELYASVNLLKRCPPAPIIDMLLSKQHFQDLDNLYFRFKESDQS